MAVKQVIVIRKDLGMRKGKMIAQGAHASMAVFFNRGSIDPKINEIQISVTREMLEWYCGIFTKVVVGVNSEAELLEIYDIAMKKQIPCALIQDVGKTEFNGVPTYTSIAIGPAKVEDIDQITGNLSLL
jgi:peptidyl-tRNA hydrolase, PTH2 family